MRNVTRALALALTGAAALLMTACEAEQGYQFEEIAETEMTDDFTDDFGLFETEPETIVPVETQAAEPETAAPVPVEETVYIPETSVEDVNYGFRSGVWVAKNVSADTERYFMFYDDNNGKYLEQQNGMGMGFTCELTPTEGIFHFGSPDDATRATFTWIDANTLVINWDDGRVEETTFLRDNGAEELRFYSNEQLCAMALDDYQTRNNYRPSMANAVINLDETIAVHLYDVVDDRIETSDWYIIDRYTGEGVNQMNEVVKLSEPSTTTAPGETLPVVTEAPTEAIPGESVPAVTEVPVA